MSKTFTAVSVLPKTNLFQWVKVTVSLHFNSASQRPEWNQALYSRQNTLEVIAFQNNLLRNFVNTFNKNPFPESVHNILNHRTETWRRIKAEPAPVYSVCERTVQFHSGSTRALGYSLGCSRAAGRDHLLWRSGSLQTPCWLQTAAWSSWSLPARRAGRVCPPARAGSALEGRRPGRRGAGGRGHGGVWRRSTLCPVWWSCGRRLTHQEMRVRKTWVCLAGKWNTLGRKPAAPLV